MIQPFAERTHEKMKDVLMHPDASGPTIHYYMIRGGSDKKNITVWEPGTVGGEYIKAYGHYHVGDLDETYWILSGKGILLLQICRKNSQGQDIKDEIEKTVAVTLSAGESAYIPSGVGHLMVNTGDTWLVARDDSPVNFNDVDPVSLPGHADYESVHHMKGFAYYVVEEEGRPTFVKNPTYKYVPPIVLMSADEYKQKGLV
ncbi:MAG: hypothetical protein RL094_257 [Candidatus Parcubacteria bacterium]|jgi:glucose-6-phosphate isomerase